MYEVLIVVYLIVAIAIVGLVLIQQGKGADMGASFGGGSSGTLFGSSGAGNFLTRSTGVLATIFFVLSLILGNLTVERSNQTSEFENLEAPIVETTEAIKNSDVPVGNKDGDVPN
ncbi:preprotein translocase subunit SecG [Psychrobium sp. 1_MG-2023]|uniref:preprotein translocase subunit SecG n=1 Tax=Psychrobium sp. 1_MG-2023 TaxID=3062624 RepID=UPI000C33918F|nr:preprotein translocase subunit SecG [Psychrobium sp. 1_MG-2023]MDP2562676.1 preprotein translocase subunit SecG [Psychrobium sp. 1_MG-2023]PKF54810.1 preprotein translocase subunit SecG [Alteromonadales bacterium alter-6D02]